MKPTVKYSHKELCVILFPLHTRGPRKPRGISTVWDTSASGVH